MTGSPDRAATSATLVYFDFMRLSAAMLVFLSHVAGQRFTGGFLWQLDRYGGQRVTMFFVLSGFMIALLAAGRDSTPKAFFANRAARLYSVLLPALVLTAVLDHVGLRLRPDLYFGWEGYHPERMVEQYLRAATFTNMTWGFIGGPGSNVPLWTLGLEAFYYAILGLILFASSAWRVVGVLAVMALAGPIALMMLPVWAAGVGTYHLCMRWRPTLYLGLVLMSAPVLIWVGYETTIGAGMHARALPYDILPWTYAAAVMFCVHVIGANGVMPHCASLLRHVRAPLRWLAGGSFSIYAFHMPIIQFLNTVTPWEAHAWQNRALMIGGTLLLIYALAELTERRKEPWRNLFAWMVGLRAVPSAPPLSRAS